MKTKIIIAGLVAAAAAVTVYFIRKRKSSQEESEPIRKTHHLTDAFARAKQVSQG